MLALWGEREIINSAVNRPMGPWAFHCFEPGRQQQLQALRPSALRGLVQNRADYCKWMTQQSVFRVTLSVFSDHKGK